MTFAFQRRHPFTLGSGILLSRIKQLLEFGDRRQKGVEQTTMRQRGPSARVRRHTGTFNMRCWDVQAGEVHFDWRRGAVGRVG